MPKKSSKRWLKEHFKDQYVKKAQHEGLRSRAYFKLQEIDERNQLFEPGMVVVDLGASPGGWSEYVIQRVGKKGRVIALDILPMNPIPGVEFIQGDIQEEKTLQELLRQLSDKKVDWIISDMAPNLSGIDSVDQPRSIALAELGLDLALCILNAQGGLLVKVFQGEGFDNFLANMKQYFRKIVIRKPKASRGRSREVFILATPFEKGGRRR